MEYFIIVSLVGIIGAISFSYSFTFILNSFVKLITINFEVVSIAMVIAMAMAIIK